MIGITGMVAGIVECMDGTRNESERLKMRAGMGIDKGMNDIPLAALDEEACILY